MQPDQVTVLIHLQLLPDFVERGRSDLLDLAREVRNAEPECLAIELAHDTDDRTKIVMIEKWISRAAYEGPHMQSKHMQAFIERSSRYFVGPPTISFHHGTTINPA